MLNPSRYFRISVTNRCNFSCFFCHNEGNFLKKEETLSPEELAFICKIALEMGFLKFKLTGGEPLLRDDLPEIISLLTELNIPDLSVITNGSLLEERALELWKAGLRRLNITLNTISQTRFSQIQGRNSQKVVSILRGIETAQKVGFNNIKLNFVYYDNESRKDLSDLLSYGKERGLTLVVLPVLSESQHYTLDFLYEIICSYGILSEELVSDQEGIRKRLIRLQSGASVLLRVDELADRRPYVFCCQCPARAVCREGIFPIRLSSGGELIPCMANQNHRISIRGALTLRDTERIKHIFRTIDGWYRINA